MMVDQKRIFPADTDGGGHRCCLDDFARYIERNADLMERTGWVNEAVHLRKWVTELRGKRIKTPYADFIAGSRG